MSLSESDARWMQEQLTAVAAKLGIAVRVEAVGARDDERSFQGGTCRVSGRQMIVVDCRLSAVQQCRALAVELRKIDVSQVFISPRVRQFIEDESL